MTELDTSDWGEFKVGDLFEKLERGRVKSVSALDDGDIPYIGAVVSNNGHSRSVTVDNSLIFEGNAIVLIQTGQGGIGLNTYQKEPFAAHANVAVGYNRHMSELSGLFVVSCLNQSVNVFSYDYSTGRNLKKETVKLPTTAAGEPDWGFMDSYMSQMMDRVTERAQTLQRVQLQNQVLDTSGWGEFVLGDIAEVSKGRRLRRQDMTDGEHLYVGASASNNGITRYIANDEYLNKPHCLTVCYNGSVGETFYQAQQFWASDDVNIVRVRQGIGEYAYQFLATLLRRRGKEYGFTHKWTSAKMKAETIKLPITDAGEPDWDFMESYMMQVMDQVSDRAQKLKDMV